MKKLNQKELASQWGREAQRKYRERIGEEAYLKIKRDNAKKGGQARKKKAEKVIPN